MRRPEPAPPRIPKPRHITRRIPFTWPELAILCLCCACVFGCLALVLEALEKQRQIWAQETRWHDSCEFLGQCGPVTDDHYRREP